MIKNMKNNQSKINAYMSSQQFIFGSSVTLVIILQDT